MNTDDFINCNFNTAHKIHEQCERQGLSRDMARLLTYIHFRLYKNETDEEKGSLDHSEIAQAIDFINDKGGKRTFLRKSGCYDAFVSVSENIKTLDESLRDDHGFELRIKSELNKRALLHRDRIFRERMLELYRNKILPCITEAKGTG